MRHIQSYARCLYIHWLQLITQVSSNTPLTIENDAKNARADQYILRSNTQIQGNKTRERQEQRPPFYGFGICRPEQLPCYERQQNDDGWSHSFNKMLHPVLSLETHQDRCHSE